MHSTECLLYLMLLDCIRSLQRKHSLETCCSDNKGCNGAGLLPGGHMSDKDNMARP